MSRKAHKKRWSGTPAGGSAFSKSLRSARDLIGEGKHEDGLAALNALAADVQAPKRRGRIALLIGESQAKLSRHAEAAAAFGRAGAFGRQAQDMDLVLAAGIGETRSLLRALKTEEAKASATALLADIDVANSALEGLLALTPEALAVQGTVQLPPRPPRPTVALTRIASAFVESGLTGEARVFLEKAIILSPNGASRARQILARLALAADDPARAEVLARESLQMGRFQAKTVAAWPLYLDARARQGLVPVLEPLLYRAFTSHARGRTLAASVLSIVRTLRSHGDAGWKAVAEGFLATRRQSDGIVATEIEKILHADAKLTRSEEPAVLASRALKLFEAAVVSPAEQVAHAKEHVRYSMAGGQEPKVSRIVRLARERFGAGHADVVRHSMALGAMMAGRHDLARSWLELLLNDLPVDSDTKGKATWALARMEGLLGRDAEASVWYLQIAANSFTPPRFRIQALLRGFKHLQVSGGAVDLPAVTTSVRGLLSTTTDYRVALDAARQLGLAGSAFASLKEEAATRGTLLADQAFAAAKTSAEAMCVIEYLARKQRYDLHDPAGILERWEKLNEPRRSELALSVGTLWFEYLAHVFVSLVKSGRDQEARALAVEVIENDKAPPEGYVVIGTEYALWCHGQGDQNGAYESFEWIAREAPSHRRAAVAHYHLMLKAIRAGTTAKIRGCARAARGCFGSKPALLWEWEIDCRCAIALADLGDVPDLASFSPDFVKQQREKLAADL